MKLKSNNFKLFIYIIFFRITLDFLYVNVYYTESILLSRGIFNLEIDVNKLIVSYIIFLVFSYYVVNNIMIMHNKPSEIMFLGLYLMSFTPTVSLFGLANLSYNFISYFLIFWVIFSFAISLMHKTFLSNTNKRKILKINDYQRYLIWIMTTAVFLIMSLIISIKVNGLNLNFNLNSIDIYNSRSNFKEKQLNVIFEYFRNNAMYVIVPFTGVYAFKKKNFILLSLVVITQLFLYGIDNQKAALFLLPVSILAYKIYKNHMMEKVPLALFLLNILIYLEFTYSKTTFLVGNILERVYYLPAILSSLYYDYFSVNENVIPFSGVFNKLGWIHNNNYGEGVPYILGGIYFKNPEISANTGMFGSAFSYGIQGVVLIPLAYVMLFYLLNVASSGIEINTFISILIIQIFVITGTTIFVVISAYGLILSLFILSLLNNNNKFNDNAMRITIKRRKQ
ncbi:hypothetical protein A0126_12830 [Exiguobacterium sp. N4-1P]|uniref:hypothetical protein n=1 Tax=Exiguobacterium sp. N4-1P TaxID=2051906 RepID=UPI000B58C935|nr:hypothetical protein [Exiguobacterium sp. N4-1P]ASI36431.1 hypothetical protein A0126_12830 [Exiguobacterium sp. N4-1P]